MKHFTIRELTHSATAARLHIDNTPPASIVANLEYLVEVVLDPLREKVGRPVIVNCAYRCRKLNTAVGGASNSQHLTGLAADIHVNGASNRMLADAIVRNRIPFDQLILEKGTPSSPQWIHVSIDRVHNRGQILYYDGKRYVPYDISKK